MNKVELVEVLAKKLNVTKKEAAAFLTAFTETVLDALVEGRDVKLLGFGNFSVTTRDARKGRNPQTGEVMEIPAHKAVRFKPGKALKDAVK